MSRTNYYGISKKETFKSRIRSKNETRDYSSQMAVGTSKSTAKTVAEAKKRVKSLGDYKRCPENIRCGDEVVKNFEKPVTIARGLDFGNSLLITDHHHENLMYLLDKYAKDRPILACIAWLTDKTIINAMSQASKVMVIINDENYATWGGGCVTREKYAPLPGFGDVSFSNYWGHIQSPLNFEILKNKRWEAVRCYGQKAIIEREAEELKKQGTPGHLKGAFMPPIMHAKFMIISDKEEDEDGNIIYTPRWLWMGSMNFTGNSANNIEQCTFMDCKPWALHMFFTFGTTFLCSSPVRY